jgi:phosphate transport system protein
VTGRVHFDQALHALRVEVDVLGGLAEEAVRSAVGALVGDDRHGAERVVAGDDRIDGLFVALEERAYELIAREAPVAVDLRFLMSALRVMADFEKVGDRAVSVAKIALAAWPRQVECVALLGRMGEASATMVSDARRAWREQDLILAADLKRRDDTLDESYRAVIAHLLGQEGPDVPALVLNAHAAGRHLERIADHAVIVGERVVYLLTGDPSSLAAEAG